jgi:hypothetical protein
MQALLAVRRTQGDPMRVMEVVDSGRDSLAPAEQIRRFRFVRRRSSASAQTSACRQYIRAWRVVVMTPGRSRSTSRETAVSTRSG